MIKAILYIAGLLSFFVYLFITLVILPRRSNVLTKDGKVSTLYRCGGAFSLQSGGMLGETGEYLSIPLVKLEIDENAIKVKYPGYEMLVSFQMIKSVYASGNQIEFEIEHEHQPKFRITAVRKNADEIYRTIKASMSRIRGQQQREKNYCIECNRITGDSETCSICGGQLTYIE